MLSSSSIIDYFKGQPEAGSFTKLYQLLDTRIPFKALFIGPVDFEIFSTLVRQAN